jgi:hypothetical protein
MPKILISGNGFDLSLGLPTSYSDFINILNQLENNKISFEEIYKNCSNYTYISENCKPFNFEVSILRNLEIKISKNIWYQFFKSQYEIETWIDFENKIEYVLNVLFSSIVHFKENIFSKKPLEDINIVYNSRLFNNNIEIIQVLNEFKIINYKNFEITLIEDYLIKNIIILLILI